MRTRGVGARGDDREVRTLVAGGEHPLDQLAMHVELRTTRERAPTASRSAIESTACAARVERRDLVVVLDHADRTSRPRTRARTRTKAPHVGDRARTAPTCGRRSRHAAPTTGSSRPRARSGRRSPPTPRRRTALGAGATRGASSRGTTSCASPRPRQHEHRQTLERHRLVAREVRKVGTDREQQRVDTDLVHARPRTRAMRSA